MEQATLSSAVELARDFYAVLLERDSGTLGALARGPLTVDDPLFGRWEGDGFAERFGTCAAWLHERSVAYFKGPLTIAEPRAVQEWTLKLAENGRDYELPVAVVAEALADGSASVRVYHSTWPIDGSHRLRPPLMPCAEVPLPNDVVSCYQRALADADLETIVDLFGEKAYAREPAGGEYVFRGRDEIRHFYGLLFASGGGIGLKHCTVTDDGTCCAIEYIADRWGGQEMEPQAGVAVYQRESPTHLAAARIYDDVTPPPTSDTSR